MLQTEGLQRRLLQGLFGAGAVWVVFGLSPILLLPLLITRWGVDVYGQWITAQAIASFVTMFSNGFIPAVQSEVSILYARGDRDRINEVISTMLVGVSGVTFVCALLVYLFFQFFLASASPPVVHAVLPLWMLYLLLGQNTTLLLKTVTGFGLYGKADSVDAFLRFTELVVMFSTIFFLHFTPQEAVKAMLLANVFALAVAFRFFRANAPWVRWTRPEWSVLRSLALSITSSLVATLAYSQLLIQGVRILIGYSFSMQDAGSFNVMNTAARMLRIPVEVVVTGFRVEFGFLHGAQDIKKLRTLFFVANQFAIILTLGGVIFMVLFGEPIIGLFSRHAVEFDNKVFYPLLISIAAEGCAFACYTYLLGTSRMILAGFVLTGALATSYLLVYLFPTTLGLHGLAIAMAGSNILYSAVMVAVSVKSLSLTFLGLLEGIVTIPPIPGVSSLRKKWPTI